MRRHTLPGALALLTFALGVGAALLSYEFDPQAVSPCDLARHPAWYDQKVVRVRGVASAIYDGAVISEAMCEADGAWAAVMLDENYKPTPEVESFLAGQTAEVRKAEVLVVGRFDRNATPGCFGPRFGIRAERVELQSPVTVEPLPVRQE